MIQLILILIVLIYLSMILYKIDYFNRLENEKCLKLN
jgi:hypothetical protein